MRQLTDKPKSMRMKTRGGWLIEWRGMLFSGPETTSRRALAEFNRQIKEHALARARK